MLKKISSWFNKPKPKAQRRQSRILLSTDFDASSTTRRMMNWGLSTSGPNAALYGNTKNIRKRSRKLRNDNPWIANGIESHVANLIGRGITPRWKTKDKGLNKEIKQLWDECVPEMDADEVLDFYGLQALAATTLIESGEVLGQMIYQNPYSDSINPLKLRLMEPDQFDDTSETLENGNKILMGVELNSKGARAAYHLYKDHPGEYLIAESANLDSIRIPAKNILHMFKPLRTGQVRGTPWLTTIITRTYQLDEYEDAELKRKAMAAMFAAFVISPEGNPDDVDIPGEEDTYDEEDVISLQPGTIQSLKTGEDIKFSNPVDVGQTYEVWIRQQLRAVAAGMGITYEQLTGDLTGVNYTSIRAGLIEFRRRCRMTQRNILTHQFCRAYAMKWLDAVILANIINIRDYWQNRRRYIQTIWDPDGWDFTDPWKDLRGKQLGLRLGIQSRAQVVGEQGNDVEVLDEEIAEDNKRADSKGLIFDGDPRKTAISGTLQKGGE